jgi:hypothetical protein
VQQAGFRCTSMMPAKHMCCYSRGQCSTMLGCTPPFTKPNRDKQHQLGSSSCTSVLHKLHHGQDDHLTLLCRSRNSLQTHNHDQQQPRASPWAGRLLGLHNQLTAVQHTQSWQAAATCLTFLYWCVSFMQHTIGRMTTPAYMTTMMKVLRHEKA